MAAHVLAAIDNSLAARPVLEEARLLASILAATVSAVHVREGSMRTATAVAESLGIPLTRLDGPPIDAIATALAAPDVVLGVLGARGGVANGRDRPAGHTALAVVLGARKPVVVVGPHACIPAPGDPVRVALPLEGDALGHEQVEDFLAMATAHDDVKLIPVHVLVPEDMPVFWDQPHHAAAAWSHEFLARHQHEDTGLVLRKGAPGREIVDAVRDVGAHLVVLDWAQSLSPERARVVRDVLAHVDVPVMLAPRSPGVSRDL